MAKWVRRGANRADDDNCGSEQIKERPNHLYQPSWKILQLLFLLGSRQSQAFGIQDRIYLELKHHYSMVWHDTMYLIYAFCWRTVRSCLPPVSKQTNIPIHSEPRNQSKVYKVLIGQIEPWVQVNILMRFFQRWDLPLRLYLPSQWQPILSHFSPLVERSY